MWNSLVGTLSDKLPKFNDYLLREFRPESLKRSPDYMGMTTTECLTVFGDKMKYHGYEVLTPEERVEYIFNRNIQKRTFEIQQSNLKLIRISISLDNIMHNGIIPVPYLSSGRLVLSDTHYYPLFAIVERGLHITKNEIIVKVLRAPLKFWRRETIIFRATDGRSFRPIVMTVKIHQKVRSGKKSERTPLILYHLTQYGFAKSAEIFGFKSGDIQLVDKEVESDRDFFYFIKLKDDVFIKVRKECMSDQYMQGFVGSIVHICEFNSKYTLKDLTSTKSAYYHVTLGRHTYGANKDSLLYNNAEEHLRMNDSLLDPAAKVQLATIGINVSNIYELLREIYFKMDSFVWNYNPIDLYNKKLGSLEQMLSGFVRNLYNAQFRILNNKKIGLTQESAANFIRDVCKRGSFVKTTQIYRGNPSIYNDNWLLTIGAKRFRSLEAMELNVQGVKKKCRIPPYLTKAHPSHMVVESLLTIPTSTPVISGSINPYLKIDREGNIIKPVNYLKYAKVFA